MRVRGVGNLELAIEIHEKNKLEKLCVVGSYYPLKPNEHGVARILMTLRPFDGLNLERFRRILQEAVFKNSVEGVRDPKAPGVIVACFKNCDDKETKEISFTPSFCIRTILTVECRGSVENIAGIKQRVADILKKAAKKVDAG